MGSWALGAAAGLFVVFGGVRLLGIDGGQHLLALTSLTPYVLIVGIVLGVIALVVRKWVVAAVTLLLSAVLVGAVVPRAFADGAERVDGREVRIMSANLMVGKAVAEDVVRVVASQDVDILTMQELTPAMVKDFERAGLDRFLPYRVFLDEPGGSGSGIASRHPLTRKDLTGPSTMRQAGAVVDLPGTDVEILSVHPLPPVVGDSAEHWQRDMDGLPRRDSARRDSARRDSAGPIRILAGDFNATLDHAGLRRLLDSGYVDAADRTGHGLTPTWPADGSWLPPVTIDHVLADDRCQVLDYAVFDIADTDHRAIVSRLVVPSAPGRPTP
ncbi:endonuclease/exonuclease/phosphatase family protein [Saccharothrix violaceirubra]